MDLPVSKRIGKQADQRGRGERRLSPRKAWPQPCSQDVSAIKWDNVILYGQGRSSIVPGSAKERVLMLYFNTNLGATLCWRTGSRTP